MVLFATQEAAITYAADLIRRHEPEFVDRMKTWYAIDELSDQRVLQEFNDELNVGEWLQVVPVENRCE